MNKLTIRKASDKDLDKIQDVIRKSLESAKEKKSLKDRLLFNDYSTGKLKEAKKRTEMFVAVKNGKIVATGRLEKTHEIRMIYVIPEMQRKGIGSLIMAYLEKIASRKKWKSVHVKALWSARGFYSKIGYAEVKTKSREFCFMRKFLK